MPTKKSVRKNTSQSTREHQEDVRLENLTTPSYVNLVYGAVTVVVLFILIIFSVKTFLHHKTGEITEEAAKTHDDSKNSYVVQKGDTLWSIAENKLGSGYRWVEIVDANHIVNPTDLKEGTSLIIPESGSGAASLTAPVSPTQTPEQLPVSTASASPQMPNASPTPDHPIAATQKQYTVQRDDTLWDISVRAYGDGYHWVEIARANNLSNPDLIFSGNQLILPR